MAKNNRVSIMGNRSHDKKSGVERYTYTEIQFPRDHKPDINDKYQDLTNRYIYMDIKCTAISYADRTHTNIMYANITRTNITKLYQAKSLSFPREAVVG